MTDGSKGGSRQDLKPPQPRYCSVFNDLFNASTARDGFAVLEGRDPLAGAFSLKRESNFWRTWKQARRMSAGGNFRDAIGDLQRLNARFPPQPDASDVAELEHQLLMATCLTEGNNFPDAIFHARFAQEILRRFIVRTVSETLTTARELTDMLETLCGLKLPSPETDDGLVAAWIVTRGVDLACTLAQLFARLPRPPSEPPDAPALELEADRMLIEECGFSLEGLPSTRILFALGDVLTEVDPTRAFEHFEAVVFILGVEHGLGLQAAVNAANCLLRLDRFEEAEARYGSLESLFEMRGNRAGAARVWIAECIANWKRLRDPAVCHSLIGALKMYEESIPRGADVATRYTYKRLAESGYDLLIAAIAQGNDRSDKTIDDLLAAVQAVLSKDMLADFEPAPVDDPWEALLQRERRPLAAMKTALLPYPELGVVSVLSVTDTLVWLAMGYDATGQFRFICQALGDEHGGQMVLFLEAMHDQLKADQLGDGLAVFNIGQKLEMLGERIAASLCKDLRLFLTSMKRIMFMPAPYQSLDEFPLAGLRFDGRLLGEIVPIVRSSGMTHLREALSCNRGIVRAQSSAFVVLGAPEVINGTLRKSKDAAARARQWLGALGFTATVVDPARRSQFAVWLSGGAGVIHYIGHGMANEIHEGLPLSAEESLGIIDADRVDGFRIPFFFICACMAGRVRSGQGGYHAGVASKLIDRGAPAVVAFNMPVTENAAYTLAGRFYRAAAKLPFGEAVQAVVRDTDQEIPLYARLAMTAFGDPAFRLPDLATGPFARMLRQDCESWSARLRTHAVLRSDQTLEAATTIIGDVPEAVREPIQAWLSSASSKPANSETSYIDRLDKIALEAPHLSPAERLTLRGLVLIERLRRSGIESVPIFIPTDPDSIRSLLSQARFLAQLGAALWDMGFNGLGNSLLGRILTVDQNDARPGALYLRQGREKLRECEDFSPFVEGLRADDALILSHFGLSL